jgi:hypothetical protein
MGGTATTCSCDCLRSLLAYRRDGLGPSTALQTDLAQWTHLIGLDLITALNFDAETAPRPRGVAIPARTNFKGLRNG